LFQNYLNSLKRFRQNRRNVTILKGQVIFEKNFQNQKHSKKQCFMIAVVVGGLLCVVRRGSLAPVVLYHMAVRPSATVTGF
jgi:hypothetical protein